MNVRAEVTLLSLPEVALVLGTTEASAAEIARLIPRRRGQHGDLWLASDVLREATREQPICPTCGHRD